MTIQNTEMKMLILALVRNNLGNDKEALKMKEMIDKIILHLKTNAKFPPSIDIEVIHPFPPKYPEVFISMIVAMEDKTEFRIPPDNSISALITQLFPLQ
jgi:hypothetical protein